MREMKHVTQSVPALIFPVLLIFWCGSRGVRPQASQDLIMRVDARAEVASALYAASATQAAAERFADARTRAKQVEIERLRGQIRTDIADAAQLKSALTAAQETYVADLASRDRAYAQEIGAFRSAVQDIAATPDGAAALSRFNAGDESGALAILDDLRKARDAARQKGVDIESASEGRRIATLALEARSKGKVSTAQVIARFTEVTRLDPGVHSDWVQLARLYRDAGTLSEALRAANRAGDTAANDRDRSLAVNEVGDVLLAQGDLKGALASYRQGLAIAEALAGHDPTNNEWQRDLSVSYNKIGEVLLAQGDGPGALAIYRRELAIAELLAARDPANTEWQRDLSVSHEKIGDVLLAQGDGPGALADYRKELAIAEPLAARDPANTEWQLDLSVSHTDIGDVLMAQGDGPGALAAYRKGLTIAEALAGRDPTNREWQRDLSVSHQKIGDVLTAQGDRAGALAAYRKNVAIGEDLTAHDPANKTWQIDLTVSYGKIGDVLAAQGDGPEALTAYRKGLAVTEALAERDPADTARQRDLSVSHSKIGDVLAIQGDRIGAMAAYGAGIGITEELAASDSNNADWQRDLVVSLVKLGDLTGEKAYAARALKRVLEMKQRGILAPQDAWMVDELRRRASQ